MKYQFKLMFVNKKKNIKNHYSTLHITDAR